MTKPSLTSLLNDVGRAWETPEEARRLVEAALLAYPDAEDAYVAAYRFYFYRNELPAAISIAEQCLRRVLAELSLPADWRDLSASNAQGVDFSDPAMPRHRFLLFALNAYAYLLARLGKHADADAAFAVVARLDPADRIGATRLRQVLQRGPDPDDSDD